MDATREIRKRREWCYVQPPAIFEVAPCSCGNAELQWSEFEGHVWCDRCQIDFVPAHHGIFDGPVPIQVARAMGMRFDRYLIKTGEVQRYDFDKCEYLPPVRPEVAAG